jgi:hypothetical protein
MENKTDVDASAVPPEAALARARARGPLESLGSVGPALALCILPTLRFLSLEDDMLALGVSYVLLLALALALPVLLRRYERRHVGAWTPRPKESVLAWTFAGGVLAFLLSIFVFSLLEMPYGWRATLDRVLPVALVAGVLGVLSHDVWHSERRGWHAGLALAYLTGVTLGWSTLPTPALRWSALQLLSGLSLALRAVLSHARLRALRG